MVNQNSVLPIYYQVKTDLVARIDSNEFPPGAQLPSEAVLSREYDVSRQAMRHALNELATQGLVRPRRGIGWFVNGARLVKPLPLLSSYSAQMAALSPDSAVRVLSQATVEAPSTVARALELEVEQRVFRIDRLGTIAGEPVTLLTAYIPLDLCPGIVESPLEGDSLYERLEEECGVRFIRASSRLEVVFADPTQAGLLRVKEGHPLLRLEGTSFTETGLAGEYTTLDYIHERFSFTIESYRDQANRRTVIAAG